MLRRSIQLLSLALLLSVNSRVGASMPLDACEDNGPQWCCEVIYCPIAESLCYDSGGEPGACYWEPHEQLCKVEECDLN